jgi:hypothetical protein
MAPDELLRPVAELGGESMEWREHVACGSWAFGGLQNERFRLKAIYPSPAG